MNSFRSDQSLESWIPRILEPHEFLIRIPGILESRILQPHEFLLRSDQNSWNPGILESWNLMNSFRSDQNSWNPRILESWNLINSFRSDQNSWNPGILESWNPGTLES